jgi:exopolyphosphatase/guanosine-5'-triphosphate,3'-diphosphate pyrophosphatase
VATEACRLASNGADFIARVEGELGLALEIIDRETEAKLAAAGAEPLIAEEANSAVVFDIGGGSTEVMWVERGERTSRGFLSRLVSSLCRSAMVVGAK